MSLLYHLYVCDVSLVFVLQLYNTSVHAGTGENNKQVCCICQEKSYNPVELPCKHIFCYLCIKGVAARQSRCALCRSPIPFGYIDRPSVINRSAIRTKLEQSQDTGTYHWFYEAKSGGWWLYEQRMSSEIEKAYTNGKKSARMQIAGFSYVINFEEMVQFREDVPTRRRRIKRDVVKKETVRGIAGIHVKEVPRSQDTGEDIPRGSVDSEQVDDENQVTPEVGGEEYATETQSSQTHSRLVTGFDH